MSLPDHQQKTSIFANPRVRFVPNARKFKQANNKVCRNAVPRLMIYGNLSVKTVTCFDDSNCPQRPVLRSAHLVNLRLLAEFGKGFDNLGW